MTAQKMLWICPARTGSVERPRPASAIRINRVKAKKGNNIRVELSKSNNPEGSRYVLTIENLKKKSGRYYDVVTIKTDSSVQPEIKLSVYGNILDKKPAKTSSRNPSPGKPKSN